MVASIRFAAAALFLSLALPSLALEAPSFFPANLAKRFTGKLPSIKRTPTPTVARSLSDDLIAMLAGEPRSPPCSSDLPVSVDGSRLDNATGIPASQTPTPFKGVSLDIPKLTATLPLDPRCQS